jgi:predicted phage terminase large subunit-like protein
MTRRPPFDRVGATVNPPRDVGYPVEQIELIAKLNADQAVHSFAAFRRAVKCGMLWSPFVGCLTAELQRFHEAFVAGKRPKLAIMTPPQHGKSRAVEDFIAWVAGKHPEWKTIYASYSEKLGVLRNRNLQRLFRSQCYRDIFPSLLIDEPGWQCNDNLIEYVGGRGSFRNTTVKGPITGLELHLAVLDDFVKSRAEAGSKIKRDHTWHWFTDDFLSRFAADSALVIICTRWHVDDLLGRYIAKDPTVRQIVFPAIAEEDEKYRKRGEALFPALKPLSFLLERKALMTQSSWEAEYQQHPYLVGGGMFPVELFRTIHTFDRREVIASVLAVDKAGTAGGDGAFTAIVLMHKMKSGQFVIERVVRGHWSASEREKMIKQCAETDRANRQRHYSDYKIVVEQEPGSGGKESAEATIRNLAGYTVIAYKPTGEKAVRAEPLAAQVQGGNVFLHAGSWHRDFLEEAESWPHSPQLDQIDAAAVAFNHLTGGYDYDHSYSGWQ